MEAESIARLILWGLDEVPTARSVVRKALGSGGRVEAVDVLPGGDACAHREGDGWTVKHRVGLTGPRLRWALVHEAVEVALARLAELGPQYLVAGDVERFAEAVTGAVVMPREPFIREAWRARMDHREVARLFGVTQSAAVLRFAEVGLLAGSAVVHPHFRIARGVLPADGRSVIKRPVTDAPLRTAHLAA